MDSIQQSYKKGILLFSCWLHFHLHLFLFAKSIKIQFNSFHERKKKEERGRESGGKQWNPVSAHLLINCVWWYILCLKLTGFALRAGKTLFPGVFVRASWEKISIWNHRLSKDITLTNAGRHHPIYCWPDRAKKQKGKFAVPELRHPSALGHSCSWFSSSGTQVGISHLASLPFLGIWTRTELHYWVFWFSSL